MNLSYNLEKGDKNMFLYQYKNSKSSYDFKSASQNFVLNQDPFNSSQISNNVVVANTTGLRAIRGGNSHRVMSTLQSVTNFRAYN